MWIMAVHAFDEARWIHRVFSRVMHPAGVQDRVDAEFAEISLYVFGSDISAVATVTVLFFVRKCEQPGTDAGGMGRVAILAGIGGDGLEGSMGPGVVSV